jgi:hypothetical protein
MTILITEIYTPKDLTQATIVFAADSKVTRNGKHDSQCSKIFRVPYMKAGVGFFGLAEINNEQTASYLTNFINNNTSITSLNEWAEALKKDLQRKIGSNDLACNRIGIHLCGFNKDNLPEFWFIRNISGMDGHQYLNPLPDIKIDEQFLARDIPTYLEDGSTNMVKEPRYQVYRNGDTRVDAYAKALDCVIDGLCRHDDFKKPKGIEDYLEIVKLKIEIMCKIYKKLAKNPLIGTPIGAFAFDSNGNFVPPHQK